MRQLSDLASTARAAVRHWPSQVPRSAMNRPRLREPRLGGGVVRHVRDAEPVAEPCVAFGSWQRLAPVDERRAPALGRSASACADDQSARERPGVRLQRQSDCRVRVAGGIQQRRRVFTQRRSARACAKFLCEKVLKEVAQQVVQMIDAAAYRPRVTSSCR